MKQLQKSIGNQALGSLWRAGALQTALKVGPPGDKYEKQADAVAQQVVSAPTASPMARRMPSSPGAGGAGIVPGMKDDIRTKPLDIFRMVAPAGAREGSNTIAARSAKHSSSGGAATAPRDVSSTVQNMRASGGKPLPASERGILEARMGHDMSHVRVHTGDAAIQASEALQAKAFTVGDHIAFNKGYYQPGTTEGRRLIAHEATHTLQQGGGRPIVQRQSAQRTFTVSIGGQQATSGFVKVITDKGKDRVRADIDAATGSVTVAAHVGDRVLIQAAAADGAMYSRSIQIETGTGTSVNVEIERVRGMIRNDRVPPAGAIEAEWGHNGNPQQQYIPPGGVNAIRGLFRPNPGPWVSLGIDARYVIRFNPPLIYQGGVVTFDMTDHIPGEQFRIRLLPADAPQTSDRNSPDWVNFGQTNEIAAPAGTPRREFSRMEILTGTHAQDNTPANPGIDVTRMRASQESDQIIDQITILLDISGSMFRDQGVTRKKGGAKTQVDEHPKNARETESAETAPTGRNQHRLYQRAAEALRTNFMPRTGNIPIIYAPFYMTPNEPSKPKTHTRAKLPSTSTPGAGVTMHTAQQARWSALFDQCRSITRRGYTPIKSAVQKVTRDRINNQGNNNKSHLMLLITDGVGSSGKPHFNEARELKETLTDLSQDAAGMALGAGKRGFFELIGLSAAQSERGAMMEFKAPGSWQTSYYDARNSGELGRILAGLNSKYRLGAANGPAGASPEGQLMQLLVTHGLRVIAPNRTKWALWEMNTHRNLCPLLDIYADHVDNKLTGDWKVPKIQQEMAKQRR